MPEVKFPYGKEFLSLDIPEDRYAGTLVSDMHHYVAPKSPAELVNDAMANPIGTPRLSVMAEGKKKVVLIASDHTRPVPSKDIVPQMLAEIRQGNPEADITILISTGCHRGTTKEELISKFGPEIVANEKIVVHDCDDTANLTYIGKLRNATIGRRLGVRYLDGLQGQIAFVTGGAHAAWVAEEATASKQKPAYSKAVMSPKRLQVLQGVTYDLMHQSSKALDNLIMEDMVKAHAVALDAAIFAGSGSSGQPTGVLAASGVNSITIDASNGGPLTHDLLVQMETEVGIDNGLLDDTLAYVSNAKVQGKLKTIPQIAGYPYYLMNDGKVNGYPFYMSNAIPSNLGTGTAFSAAIFGNWSEVLVGSWGGLQLIVDPYTAKANGVLEISAAAYHDVLVRTPAAFCKIVDITTT